MQDLLVALGVDSTTIGPLLLEWAWNIVAALLIFVIGRWTA